LGVTKFTGVSTLFLLFMALLGAGAAIGAAAVPGRFGKRDLGLWGLAAFAGASLLATATSLSPGASVWGLGSYYGGLALVLLTAAGYLCVRAFARRADFDFLTLCVGATVILVPVLYTCNIFNIDLIGTYANTAVVERAQFFSTLGQKDFNAGYLSLVLPLVFWAFLQAKGAKRTLLFGIPAFFGTLGLAVVDAEGLLLGVGAALMLVVCHRSFDERQLRRLALLGGMFFCWAGWMHHMRATVYTQGGTSILAEFGAPALAIPGGAACFLVWGGVALCGRYRAAHPAGSLRPLRLYRVGRVVTVAVLAGAVALFLLANFWPGFPSLGAVDGYLIFNDDWGTYRGTAWRAAAGVWADGPWWRKLLGYGPGMMHSAVAAWAGNDGTARLSTFYAAHNEYLEQLLTTGLLGLAAWLVFVVAHIRQGLKNWARPAVAPLVLALCSYLAQAVVSIRVSMIFPEVMLLFGLLAAFARPEEAPAAVAEPAAPPQGKKRRKKPAGAAAKMPAPDPRAARKAQLVFYAKVAATAVGGMALAVPLSHLFFAFLF
ncbi:MAG: O-antigen ligase family protein, partial [Gemmiger sp.]|nr:O-antigen ligase family protein [Gemmiger sp.]